MTVMSTNVPFVSWSLYCKALSLWLPLLKASTALTGFTEEIIVETVQEKDTDDFSSAAFA